MKFKKDQGVFFKKVPSTPRAPTNAIVKRDMGELNGVSVIEIETAGNRWIVTEAECLSVGDAFAKRAEWLSGRIEPLKKDFPVKKDLAKALGICTGTLRKWLWIVSRYGKAV